jgi:hypothetical protein
MALYSQQPLDYLVMWSLVIERRLSEPFYEPEQRCIVKLDVEFADVAAAERFEAKCRKLLEDDDTNVIKNRELYAGGLYEE